jgi:hypothetical protein
MVTHIWESWQFESMYTLQGKTQPPRHVRFSHQFTYARHTLPVGGPHMWQHFMSHRQSWVGPLLLRKRTPDIIHSVSADRSTGPYLASLPSQPMKQWGQIQASISDRLLGLLDPYHQHTIGTFNSCSRVPTPRSLIDIGGSYHIKNIKIATTLSLPFPSEGSTDPPKWPCPVSIFIQY